MALFGNNKPKVNNNVSRKKPIQTPQQEYYDDQGGYDDSQGYYDSQGYDNNQGYYDDQGGYDDNQGYYDDQGGYDDSQGYYDSQGGYDNSQGYYDDTQDNDSIDFGDAQAPVISKKGKNNEPENKEFVLYMIIDKHIDGVLNFFRNYGLKVSRIFYNFQEARDTMLMQIVPTELVVVDTGTGRFSSMSSRKELLDLLGITEDDNKAKIFFIDNLIKDEIIYSKNISSKNIDWIDYKNLAGVLAYMLQSMRNDGITYLEDGDYTEAAEVTRSLALKGAKDKDWIASKRTPVQINTSEIASMCDAADGGFELLEPFRLFL